MTLLRARINASIAAGIKSNRILIHDIIGGLALLNVLAVVIFYATQPATV